MRLGIRGRSGSAMGVVLMIAAIALLAAFTAAGVSTMGLRVSTRLSNAAVAQSLAESAVQEAAARIQLNLGFHAPVEIGPGLGLPEGSIGRLTFERDAGIPYSTNNFLDNNDDGWRRKLPNHTAHLIGRGESGGVVRHVEVLLHLPEFPVALACDGPVFVTNSLISAFNPAQDRPWVPGSGFDVDEDETEPGNLITNSDAGEACVLDKKTKITGDLQARGGIRLNGASVDGEVRSPWGQEAPLPNLDPAKFDPQASPNTYYEELVSVPPSLTLVGSTRRQGSLNLASDLRLDNAFLFVDGDLTVNGALRGVGAVVVTGRCRFKGAVDIQSNEQIALISGGGIEAVGDSSERSIFQGLLYTKGPFIAKKITILGGFIVDDGAMTQIADSSIFYSGTHIVPHMKREVFAVVPRFETPSDTSSPPILFSDPTTFFPTGNWPLSPERTVRNVLDQDDPTWARSGWSDNDAAVISVRWVNGKATYSYSFWGLDPDVYDNLGDVTNRLGSVFHRQTFDRPEALATALGEANTSAPTAGFLDDRGNVPNRQAYEAYVLEVTEHLSKAVDDRGDFNFRLDPNEFISNGEDLRVLMRRVF